MSDNPFVDYYAKQSESQESIDRSRRVKSLMLRCRILAGESVDNLEVADIGCNAGTQSLVWALEGHNIHGLDINESLLAIAKDRFGRQGVTGEFIEGTATDLPWPDATMDVCLLPELLEHVPDWEQCLKEAVRVLKPGGVLYVSTTNKLCPRQMEFDLPFYSWYPAPLKRKYERLAVTSRPELVKYATYPAVNWFTPYELKAWLRILGLDAADQFDVIDEREKSRLARATLWAIRRIGAVRFAAHMATSYSIVVATKN